MVITRRIDIIPIICRMMTIIMLIIQIDARFPLNCVRVRVDTVVIACEVPVQNILYELYKNIKVQCSNLLPGQSVFLGDERAAGFEYNDI